MPGKTNIIAISGENTGGPYAIRASINGKKLVTSNGGRWRCTNAFSADWMKPGFNDKAWPVATKRQHSYKKSRSSVDRSAQWIWAAQPTKAYCRAYLRKYDEITASEGSKSSTHYLSDANRFDVSSKEGPLLETSNLFVSLR